MKQWANFLKVHSWEKWDGSNKLYANIGDKNTFVSNRSDMSVGAQGRIMHIAMALDKAQAA